MVRFVLAATIAVALTSVLNVSRASAAEPQASAMVVTCNEMCGGCVKKIEKRFAEDKGLVVTYDIPTKTVAFQPAPGRALSAKGIWTAMDKIGKTPVQLVEANGTVHTKKPE